MDLNAILGSGESQTGPVSVKTEAQISPAWFACIFCSKKIYTDLPSLQAHIKRTHYHRALQILSFAGNDVKQRLLEFWRHKNRSIDATQVMQAKMSKRHRMASAKTDQLSLVHTGPTLPLPMAPMPRAA